jgi:hypothetical protein
VTPILLTAAVVPHVLSPHADKQEKSTHFEVAISPDVCTRSLPQSCIVPYCLPRSVFVRERDPHSSVRHVEVHLNCLTYRILEELIVNVSETVASLRQRFTFDSVSGRGSICLASVHHSHNGTWFLV